MISMNIMGNMGIITGWCWSIMGFPWDKPWQTIYRKDRNVGLQDGSSMMHFRCFSTVLHVFSYKLWQINVLLFFLRLVLLCQHARFINIYHDSLFIFIRKFAMWIRWKGTNLNSMIGEAIKSTPFSTAIPSFLSEVFEVSSSFDDIFPGAARARRSRRSRSSLEIWLYRAPPSWRPQWMPRVFFGTRVIGTIVNIYLERKMEACF